jgi:D-3-phosphoglycerate dehydrogenase / 2-oxoglutarate reductase
MAEVVVMYMRDGSAQAQKRRVLVTDYAWSNLDCEIRVLETANASLVVAQTGDEDELVNLAADVEGILTCWKNVTEKVIRNAGRCLIISRYGVGLDNIDVDFSTKMGIVVTNVPTYCVEEVSDHAMAMLLALGRKVGFYDRSIKGGAYDLHAETPLYRIKGRTLGIVGFGSIGRALYRKAKGFGVQVIAYDRNPDAKSDLAENGEVKFVSFPDLLRESDYISIHLPLTPETRHLFNLKAFQQMKRSAFLVNTARGDIVESQDLLEALNQKLIAGAALDVLSKEPPERDDPLVVHPRTLVTPHVAFNSEESLVELRESAASQVLDVLSGLRPKHVVNREVLKQPNMRAKLNIA